ncbi:HpcH/HpaI aldolase/citrate lyase family protein [Pelagibacterium xiamenense]|uniref:HpcH/HpaI aldolase/citrate lyase family protein n=1 Tax=Pelagibacterium xiamenense TaxID=2901140 RepID=UPI001E51CCE0|nr:CoA ester lyase [Pelagibacterium xiamenense]MCD7060680.1 CoA ester lyase [Pelagibacterium xiamenense]
MRLRSLLFVPGDRPDRMEKAVASGADAVILDLEDSVSPDRKPWARKDVAAFLSRAGRDVPLLVRINSLSSPLARDDIAVVLSAKPDGLVLPKAEGAASVRDLAAMLGLSAVKVLPIATETPKSVFTLGTFEAVADRLLGLTWGAEDLSAAVGAATARQEGGRFTAPYETVRSLALFAAHAASVPAIDTVYPDIGDSEGLAGFAARSRRDGFSGMMAIHPSQVPVINEAFTPSERELVEARAIVEAFAASPGAGVLQIEGKMVDLPHLKAARALLGRAE